jgi:hypothetical protein
MSYHIGRGRYSRESYPQGNFGGGGGALNFQIVDTISVASAARLVDINTTSLEDGTIVYVRSVEDLFVLERAVALTADGITVVNPLVGTGQWTRRNVGSQRWLRQATWFINATLGNDENAGTATGAGALKTHAELERRWGPDPLLPQSVTVNIETDLDAVLDASPEINVTLSDLAILEYVGTPTQVASGTLDAATPTDPDTNTQQSVEDAAIGDFGPFVGNRIRLTANNAISWIAKAVTPTEARTGAFVRYTSSPSQQLNNYTPVGNEAYVLEELPNVRAMQVSIKRVSAQTGVINNINPFVARNLLFNPSSTFGGAFHIEAVGPLSPILFGCDFILSHFICRALPNMFLAASKVGSTDVAVVLTTPVGSLDLEGTVFLNIGQLVIGQSSSLQSAFGDSGNLFQGPGSGAVEMATGSVWTSEGLNGFFDFDIGLSLDDGAYYFGNTTYGDGNTDFGIVLETGAIFTYDGVAEVPTLTGANGDIQISPGDAYASPEDLPAVFAWGGVYHQSQSLRGARIQRGVATLVNGTVVVGAGGDGSRIYMDPVVLPRIELTRNTFAGTVAGTLEAPQANRVSGIPGTAAFTINSRTAAGAIADDDSTVDWAILS